MGERSEAVDHGAVPEPEVVPGPGPEPGPGPRVWSAPALAVLVGAALALLSATAVLLGALLLTDAPPNALSQRYQTQLNGLVYPEFEQNWRLFAPDPLQYNTDVQVRARSAAGDGGWVDLTAQDVAAIRGNPFPSHAQQNELRRAWDFYDSTHDAQGLATGGLRSPLADEYLKRIALQRLGRSSGGAPITAVQLRAVTAAVAPPHWSGDQPVAAEPVRQLSWWPVSDQDYAGL